MPTDRPDITACADEPIRVPGAIQPHGRLLVFDEDTGRPLARSANWAAADDPAAVPAALERPLRDWPADESPAPAGTLALDGGRFDASLHRRGGRVIVEFEPAARGSGTRAPIYGLARHVVPALQAARTVEELCRIATREFKRLTGFGRCLAYRFDAEGHGEVIAECADAGYASYAGHHFPASDIPPQARALYCLNYVRVIPDADYEPVPLLPCDPSVDPAAIDLSLAGLRSVSPTHLEYMRNMGTRASMSISIVAGGRLWGLVSGHDHAPHHVDFETRAACEHLGRLLSLRVEAAEEHAEVAQRLELRRLTLQLIAQRPDLDATLMGLLDVPDAMLRLARAHGAAVVLNESCRLIGDTPAPAHVIALARRIAARGDDHFATDRLVEAWPEAAAWGERCAGVLALSISQVHRHLILWFRPAVARTIRWAGEPRKDGHVDGRLHPRRSFASWQEELRDRSLPWTPAELAAVLELRQSLIAIVLRRAEELADLAGELGRANKELEAFSYTVSHDLRAPMRHISGYVDLVLDIDAGVLSERAKRYLGHVKDAAAYSGQLVDGLLDFSRMGRAAIKRGRVDTGVLVADLVREFGRLQPGRTIRWEIDADLPVLHADPLLMQVALRNLVGNAVKYTRDTPEPRIRVRAVRREHDDGLEVEDNGCGFDMKYVGKLFGVFQRLHQSDEFEGTGIGLASVRRIVERHGGHVWAAGELGRGATFGFVLPRAPET
jgi:light-regulated signal transduction histidine kinase (bacteriophytochrome)